MVLLNIFDTAKKAKSSGREEAQASDSDDDDDVSEEEDEEDQGPSEDAKRLEEQTRLEEEEFERSYSQLMVESLESRKLEKKVSHFDAPLPHVRQGGRIPLEPAESDKLFSRVVGASDWRSRPIRHVDQKRTKAAGKLFKLR